MMQQFLLIARGVLLVEPPLFGNLRFERSEVVVFRCWAHKCHCNLGPRSVDTTLTIIPYTVHSGHSFRNRWLALRTQQVLS